MIPCPVCLSTLEVFQNGASCRCRRLHFVQHPIGVELDFNRRFQEGQWQFFSFGFGIFFDVFKDGQRSDLFVHAAHRPPRPVSSRLEQVVQNAIRLAQVQHLISS